MLNVTLTFYSRTRPFEQGKVCGLPDFTDGLFYLRPILTAGRSFSTRGRFRVAFQSIPVLMPLEESDG